jgi:hypothetical protein
MRVLQGCEEIHGTGKTKFKALKLHKSIYGLVQAACQWHKKFEQAIHQQGFVNNDIDPCVFFQREGSDFCLLCILEKCNAWTMINIELMPEGRKLVVNCWDLKQKGDGIFRARLVAFGYCQVAVVEDLLGCEIGVEYEDFTLGQSWIVEKLIKNYSLINSDENG